MGIRWFWMEGSFGEVRSCRWRECVEIGIYLDFKIFKINVYVEMGMLR